MFDFRENRRSFIVVQLIIIILKEHQCDKNRDQLWLAIGIIDQLTAYCLDLKQIAHAKLYSHFCIFRDRSLMSRSFKYLFNIYSSDKVHCINTVCSWKVAFASYRMLYWSINTDSILYVLTEIPKFLIH